MAVFSVGCPSGAACQGSTITFAAPVNLTEIALITGSNNTITFAGSLVLNTSSSLVVDQQVRITGALSYRRSILFGFISVNTLGDLISIGAPIQVEQSLSVTGKHSLFPQILIISYLCALF